MLSPSSPATQARTRAPVVQDPRGGRGGTRQTDRQTVIGTVAGAPASQTLSGGGVGAGPATVGGRFHWGGSDPGGGILDGRGAKNRMRGEQWSQQLREAWRELLNAGWGGWGVESRRVVGIGFPSLEAREPRAGRFVCGEERSGQAEGRAASGLRVTQYTKPPTLAWYF